MIRLLKYNYQSYTSYTQVSHSLTHIGKTRP